MIKQHSCNLDKRNWMFLNYFLEIFLVFTLLILIWGFIIEPNLLFIRIFRLKVPFWSKKLSGLKIVILSDIHSGTPFNGEKRLERIVKKVNNLNPDIVLLLGDYVITKMPLTKTLDPLTIAEKLINITPKISNIAILGNHDYRYGSYKIKEAFQKKGIHLLENDFIELKFNEESFFLASVPDQDTGTPEIDKVLGFIEQEKPLLFLIHNPQLFDKIPDRVSLILAGDTHGGQVYLPVFKDILTKIKQGKHYKPQYRYGLLKEENKQMLITSGTGTSSIPLRIGVPPEIILLKLYPQEK